MRPPIPFSPSSHPASPIPGRAGVPMEVMGLMLGEFVDEYTVRVVDVFAMPQSGTGVSVEAVDPVFQTKMLDMLKQTGRCGMGSGWGPAGVGLGWGWGGVGVELFFSREVENVLGVHRDRCVCVVTGGWEGLGAGQRWWWGGTIPIPDSAAGYRGWTSTRSR